ncbi:hypothetical protein CLV92_104290 [Kineococcus xinjiangensis]|uniref:Uncharacterized protein n=1 Tax=Kineococcus xinjiangensis TaxID=512762 RepID=A0A2S6ITA1_9ACTN|nr:hypothetical protein [Kineococcus xinjiangensis]PPK97469.1 hypothetical protein CLV92_104290 [Kineococcus xinjiangensis]
MHIGSVTSAPNVYGARDPQRIYGISPVARINGDFPDQDPLDHLTGSDRALLAHLQAGVVDVDGSDGTAIAVLAKEIAYVRAAGVVPAGRSLTEGEISQLVRHAMSIAVRPVAMETHSRMSAFLPQGRAMLRVDVLL